LRKKIFLDTNVIISGTFFEGNESKLMSIEDIDLYTSDVVVRELKDVAIRKFKSLKMEDKRIALIEIEHSLIDFELIIEEKDSKILAAVLTIKPDCFVTGDKDFHSAKIEKLVPVRYTKELLEDLGVI